MILTISTTHVPATDLGYLLHKNPNRLQSFELSCGQAHVFYPEISEDRCTVALLLDIDQIALVRSRHMHGSEGRTLAHYVNDRPYAASSYLSVAIAQIFGSALGARCKDRPELVDEVLPLEIKLDVVPSAGGEKLLRRLFEPLGYTVTVEGYMLDSSFPEWGSSPYYSLGLKAEIKLWQALTHLYVLIPALDRGKHYAFGDEEVEKLVQRGSGWLSEHPEKAYIVGHYLRHRRSLVEDALEQLTQFEDPATDETDEIELPGSRSLTKSLHSERLTAAHTEIKASGAKRVLDLGCGEGRLLSLLFADRQFTSILGMDVSFRSVERARARLRIDRLPTMQRERIDVIHGSLIYRDKRLEGYDAAAVVEVIEHLDLARLADFERGLFEFARPKVIVITTPNSEYNVIYETLPAGQFRHTDHRFEWSRSEFVAWCDNVAARFGYSFTVMPIGKVDDKFGAPSQMAVFGRN